MTSQDLLNTMVCLVRHGETEWNALGKLQGREDIDLTPKGVEQAISTSIYLAERNTWDVVMSSPLRRARRTAEIIRNQLHSEEIIFLDDLIERDLGIAAGMNRTELAEKFPDGTIPGQEPLLEVKTRMMRVLDYTVQRFSGKGIVMVSHGAAINALLSLLSGGEIGTGKMVLDNACLNIITHDEGKWAIETYNFTQHLR